jgi:hypothetical protein
MSTDADTITDERIAAIADRMIEEGRKVSPLTVWQETPGGSVLAVAAALQRWRDAREPAVRQEPAQAQAGLPAHLAETMMSAAGQVWMAARGEADKTLGQHLGAVNQHLDTARAERDEALAGYQKTLEERDAGQERELGLTRALSASEEGAARLTAELAAANSRTESAGAREAALAQRLSVEQIALEHTKAELDEERKARDALATAIANQNDELARLTQALDAAQQEVRSLGYDCQAKSAEADRALQDAGAAASRADAATARAEAAEQHAAALQQRLAEVEQAKSLEAERWAQESSVAASHAESVAAQANESRARVAALETELSETRTALETELAGVRSALEAELAEARTALDETRTSLQAELIETRTALDDERRTSAARSDEAALQLGKLQRVAREREEAREQVLALTEAKAAALAELDQVSQEVSAANAGRVKASQEASAATERAEAAGQHAAALQQRLTDLELAKSAEVERWSQEAGAAAARAEAAAAEANESGARLAALEAERDEARAALAAASHAARSDESTAAEEIAELKRQISAQAKAHEKAFNELRTIAEQWVAHAKDLKDRLGSAHDKLLFIDSRSTGEVALIRKLSSELERLKPDSELISRDAQQKLISATMTERLSQKGYQYDPATAVMSKVER